MSKEDYQRLYLGNKNPMNNPQSLSSQAMVSLSNSSLTSSLLQDEEI